MIFEGMRKTTSRICSRTRDRSPARSTNEKRTESAISEARVFCADNVTSDASTHHDHRPNSVKLRPPSNSSTSHHRVRAAYCTSTSSHCKRANPTQVTQPIIPARPSDLGTYASLVFPAHAAPRRLRNRAPPGVLKTPKNG
ncbi:hypothetical protein B0H10DRAFT_448889 [Mycena sp. CBHHK59/15]|nr:hypothetical protein B0H10DRAFT_448889 [Mycena sp. CBHHK59/15]